MAVCWQNAVSHLVVKMMEMNDCEELGMWKVEHQADLLLLQWKLWLPGETVSVCHTGLGGRRLRDMESREGGLQLLRWGREKINRWGLRRCYWYHR